MPPLKPPRLHAGDTIAVVSPSAPALHDFPERAARGIRWLESEGYRVRVMPHARGKRGHVSGTVEERAADLNDAFRDPEVRLILAATGGCNANALLPLIDTDAVLSDPTILQAHSDGTALLAGLHAATGLVTFHGPQLVVNHGPPEGPFPDAAAWWRRVVTDAAAPGALPHPPRVRDAYPWWETPEEHEPLTTKPNTPRRALRPGPAEGPLVGGNLQTLRALAGTPWWPGLDGAVLVWEEVGRSVPEIERSLAHLRLTGAFDAIAGMIVGKVREVESPKGPEMPPDTVDALVREATAGYGFPVVTGVDVGHFDPNLVLPFGVRARLTPEGDVVLLEGAVA